MLTFFEHHRMSKDFKLRGKEKRGPCKPYASSSTCEASQSSQKSNDEVDVQKTIGTSRKNMQGERRNEESVTVR